MSYIKEYKGFELFSLNQTNKVVICQETPDGQTRCRTEFETVEDAVQFIESLPKL